MLIYQRLHYADGSGRHVVLRKTLLTTLSTALAVGKIATLSPFIVLCTSLEVCLQAFHKSDGLRILYLIAIEYNEGTGYHDNQLL